MRPDALEAGRRGPSSVNVGIMVWLASELMFFAGLFAAWYTIRAQNPVWPPGGFRPEAVRSGLFTLVLVGSSATMQCAARAAEQGRRDSTRRWVVLTIALGAMFLANQGLEWRALPFTPATDAYGSMYYMLTGFHGLHVLGGLLGMMAVLVRMGPDADAGELSVIEAVTYYWHFVDVVWLGVYATVFLIR